jgi:hypothetical protein
MPERITSQCAESEGPRTTPFASDSEIAGPARAALFDLGMRGLTGDGPPQIDPG